MSYWVLDKACRDGGTRRYYGLQTSVVHDEVTNFADVSLLEESPEHVGAVVAICGLVEGLLGEAVPGVRAAPCRHGFNPAAKGPR